MPTLDHRPQARLARALSALDLEGREPEAIQPAEPVEAPSLADAYGSLQVMKATNLTGECDLEAEGWATRSRVFGLRLLSFCCPVVLYVKTTKKCKRRSVETQAWTSRHQEMQHWMI